LKLNQQGEIKEHIHPAGVKLPPHPQKKKKKKGPQKNINAIGSLEQLELFSFKKLGKSEHIQMQV